MNELINVLRQDGNLVVNSREVANNFGKNHQHVLRDIDELKRGVQNWTGLFIPSSYKHEQNKQEYREYLLTRDGFTLLAMGFTGKKALEWKLKYIEAFNKMEAVIKKPMSILELMELQIKAIKEVNAKVDTVDKELQEFKMDMPILGVEESKITHAVRKMGVKCLGGKETAAYQDRSIRQRVYSDIYSQLKREFGVDTYKAIKRSQCDHAVKIINFYRLPLSLFEEIRDANAQMVLQ